MEAGGGATPTPSRGRQRVGGTGNAQYKPCGESKFARQLATAAAKRARKNGKAGHNGRQGGWARGKGEGTAEGPGLEEARCTHTQEEHAFAQRQ